MIEVHCNQEVRIGRCYGYGQAGKTFGVDIAVSALEYVKDYFVCFWWNFLAATWRLIVPSRRSGKKPEKKAGCADSRGLDYALWTLCAMLAFGLVLEFYLLLL